MGTKLFSEYNWKSPNTAIGIQALYSNISGSYNTALGCYSGPQPSFGNLTNTTAIGNGAKVSADNTVVIGNSAVISIGGYQDWTNICRFSDINKTYKKTLPVLIL